MNQPLDNIFPYGIPLIIIRHPPQWLQVCVNPLYTKPRFRGVFNIRGTGSYQNYWTEAYQQIIENSVTLQGIGNDFEQCQILSTLGWPQCTYIYIHRFPWSTAQKKAQIVLQQQLSGPNRDLHWPFRNVLSFASNWWCEQLIKVNPLPWNPRSLYPKPIEWKCSFLRKAKRI